MFLLSQLIKANGVRTATLTPNWQPGVDAFFRSAVATYSTPADVPTGAAAGAVIAAPTFMMGLGYEQPFDQRAFKNDDAQKAAMKKIAAAAGVSSALDRLQVGRGTPDEVRAMTQGLINAQPPSMTLTNPDAKVWRPLDVRKIMHEHALGFDCAGYVQQAYLRATGRTRDQLGWVTLDSEGLFNLSGHGFRKFSNMADLRPGDIIAFNAVVRPDSHRDEPGHRTIVFDQREATESDKSLLRSAAGGKDFADAGPVRVIEMDSSYGSGGRYFWGGVMRQTWLFNGKKWAHLIVQRQEDPAWEDKGPAPASLPEPPPPTIDIRDGLYGPGDVVEGFYRFRADG
jgi:hypothetical protein